MENAKSTTSVEPTSPSPQSPLPTATTAASATPAAVAKMAGVAEAVLASLGAADAGSPAREKKRVKTQQSDKQAKFAEQLTAERMIKLQRQFEELGKGSKGITMEQFRTAVRRVVGPRVTDEDSDLIFMKVDTDCDGRIDWEEYMSYIMLEFSEREMMLSKAREPYSTDPRFCRADNRDIILSLHFLPTPTGGRYLSGSRDGYLTFWSKAFSMPSSQRVVKGSTGATPMWVTCVEVAQEYRLIIVATMMCDMMWYSCGTKNLEKISRIHQLPGSITAMSYYTEPPHTGSNHISFLSFGDEFGGLGLLIFSYNPLTTDVGNPNQTEEEKRKKMPKTTRVFFFTDISNGNVPGLGARYRKRVHENYVRQLRYLHKLRSWLSCCKSTATAFCMGDILHLPKTKPQYWMVDHGVNAFDYCEKLNVIVTGGYDSIIRLWNPLGEPKLVGLLEGHISPITFLLINNSKELLVSIGKNRDIIIYDLVTTTVLQKLQRKLMRSMLGVEFTAALLHPHSAQLIVASKSVAVFTSREDEGLQQQLTSAGRVVTVMLYNSLFKQVVTGDQKSKVCVFDIFTGEKVMQYTVRIAFENGQKVEVDITAMTFDSTRRRLITGTRDGVIQIWNYHNGTLLRELTSADKAEILAIAWPPNMILLSGWNRRVTVYFENADNSDFRLLRPEHGDDVLCMVVFPPRLAISASADGSVMVWSMETTYPLYMFSTLFPNAPGSAEFYKMMATATQGAEKTTVGRLAPNAPEKTFRISSNRDGVPKYWDDGGSGSATELSEGSSTLPPPKQSTGVGVEAMLTLTRREMALDTAVLLTCLTNGHVLAWPLSMKGRCLGDFFGSSAVGESINCAAVTDDNEFVILGDSAGYLKVFDISHYRCGAKGPQCNVKTDNLRRPIWNEFAFVRMRKMTDKLQLSRLPTLPLHLKCKCTGSHRQGEDGDEIYDNPPHLVNCFLAHMGTLISVQVATIQDRTVIFSAAKDFTLRSYTLQGQFLGIFGQSDQWINIKSLIGVRPSQDELPTYKTPDPGSPSKQKSGTGITRLDLKVGLPHDLRREASYTTLFILETEANSRQYSRWASVRHATAWVLAFLAKRQVPPVEPFMLPDGNPDKATAFAGNLREMIEEYEKTKFDGSRLSGTGGPVGMTSAEKDEALFRPLPPLTSSILGKAYRTITHYRPYPKLVLEDTVEGVVSPYKALPCPEINEKPTEEMLKSPPLAAIQESHILPAIDPKIGLTLGNRRMSDQTAKQVNALKRAGWIIRADGQLQRHKVKVNGPLRKSMILIPSLGFTTEAELQELSAEPGPSLASKTQKEKKRKDNKKASSNQKLQLSL